MRNDRRGLSAPSATANPMPSAVVSATAVSSSAVSAPLQYGPEESACQKRCIVRPLLLDVRRRDLVLRRERLQRTGDLESLDAVADLHAERRRVGLPVIDPERVRRAEREA